MAYPDLEPPPLGAFFAEIEAGFERLGLPRRAALGGAWAAPWSPAGRPWWCRCRLGAAMRCM